MSEPQGKRAQTREAIRSAALSSFRDRGYEATTIRLLASDLGISVGSAYYHFASKSQLVQELYVDVQEHHRSRALAEMEGKRRLGDRLRVVFSTGLDELEPFDEFGSEFLLAAINPTSDASPLSAMSSPSREILVGLFAEAVAGAREKLPAEVVSALPEALARVHLMLALTWVNDTSPGHQTTRRLIDRGIRLLTLGLPALRIPTVRTSVLGLLRDVGSIGS